MDSTRVSSPRVQRFFFFFFLGSLPKNLISGNSSSKHRTRVQRTRVLFFFFFFINPGMSPSAIHLPIFSLVSEKLNLTMEWILSTSRQMERIEKNPKLKLCKRYKTLKVEIT